MPLVPMNTERLSLAVATDWWEASYRRRDAAGDLCFPGAFGPCGPLQHTKPISTRRSVCGRTSRGFAPVSGRWSVSSSVYAMKSNRHMPLLHLMRDPGGGFWMCALPGRSSWPWRAAFARTNSAFTAGSLSSDDYRFLGAHPGVWVNADSLTALRRIAAVSPGRDVGLRINPASGVEYSSNELVRYAGAKATKFGCTWIASKKRWNWHGLWGCA